MNERELKWDASDSVTCKSNCKIIETWNMHFVLIEHKLPWDLVAFAVFLNREHVSEALLPQGVFAYCSEIWINYLF